MGLPDAKDRVLIGELKTWRDVPCMSGNRSTDGWMEPTSTCHLHHVRNLLQMSEMIYVFMFQLADCINIADEAVGAVAQLLPSLYEFSLQVRQKKRHVDGLVFELSYE